MMDCELIDECWYVGDDVFYKDYVFNDVSYCVLGKEYIY